MPNFNTQKEIDEWQNSESEKEKYFEYPVEMSNFLYNHPDCTKIKAEFVPTLPIPNHIWKLTYFGKYYEY